MALASRTASRWRSDEPASPARPPPLLGVPAARLRAIAASRRLPHCVSGSLALRAHSRGPVASCAAPTAAGANRRRQRRRILSATRLLPALRRKAGDGLGLRPSRNSPMSTGSSTARAAAGMGAVTAVSRALGFVRVLVVTAVLGTTSLGDAFQSANSVSNVLFELLAAGALSAVLVPTFVGLLDRDDQPGAERVAGGVLGMALAALGAITIAGVVGAPLLARALTIGVDPDVASDQRDLVTYLLRFFVPQVLLYAAGTVITAVLYAKRRFAVTAAAPIGNTVVMVACLAVFRVVAGPNPGLDLTTGEKLLLVAAGTGGVVAFVGVLLAAGAASGFRLRPRWPGRDPEVMALLRHSGWGVVLHTGAGLLLGAAIVTGAGVEGGVVAYQVGWVIFLAPYAVLAQPIHTAILPELVTEAREHGLTRVAASLRWALERMALLVVPATAGMMALALPGM